MLRRNTYYRAVASTDPRLAKGGPQAHAGAGAAPSAREPACTPRKPQGGRSSHPAESPGGAPAGAPRHRADRGTRCGTARTQGGFVPRSSPKPHAIVPAHPRNRDGSLQYSSNMSTKKQLRPTAASRAARASSSIRAPRTLSRVVPLCRKPSFIIIRKSPTRAARANRCARLPA